MAADFLHGIETIDVSDGSRPIRRARMSVIGVIGTAPDADGALWPYNTPIPLFGNRRAVAGLGTTGTLPAALDAIFAQIGALIVVIRVPVGQTQRQTLSAMMGSPTLKTGVYGFLAARATTQMTPRILIAPGFSAIEPTDGIASIQVNNAGAGYTKATVTIVGDGEGATAEAVLLNGQIQAINIVNPGLGYTQATAAIAGDGAGATATVTRGATRNPLVAHLQGIAERLRGIVVPDLPNATTQAAIDYRHKWGSARLFGADPWPRIWDDATSSLVTVPASPYVAGAIAASDNAPGRGVWWSPSSYEINGVSGLARPIDHSLFDPSAESQWLNSNEVATFAMDDGVRLFGNRTFSTDPAWAFLSVRRAADMVHESVEKGLAWALDRPFSVRNLVEVAESVTDFLRTIKTEGGTLGGRVWFDPSLNTKDKIKAGQWTYDYDLEPPPPAERITLRAHRNDGYITEVVAAASDRIAAL